MKQIPKAATELIDVTGHVNFAQEGEAGNVDILAYSGKPITGHWYWGGNGLVIDVEGARFNKKFYPILEQHDIGRKIGFSGKPATDNNELRISQINFLDSEPANEFINFSKQGFPYQASISVRPIRIEELEEGSSVDVNGFTFKGPGYIFREWEYRETSVCVFGADDRTKSKAFEDNGEIIEVAVTNLSKQDEQKKEMEEEEIMDLKELKEKDPEGYASLMADAVKVAEASFEQKLAVQVGTFTDQIQALQAELTEEKTSRQAEREKMEAIQREKEIKFEADKIMTAKLSASDLPERLYDKVKKLVNYSKFVAEEKLDVSTFEAAIDAEIADWVNEGVTATVIGASFTKKSEAEENFDSKDDEWLATMKSLAGQIN